MDSIEIRAKLSNAKNIDDVKAILAESGEKVTPEDTERIWQELEHHRPSGKRKLDQDEMDAVAGGTLFKERDWIKEGCAATVESDPALCWESDVCILFWEKYDNFWATCPDGTPHENIYDKKTTWYICRKCGVRLNGKNTTMIYYP